MKLNPLSLLDFYKVSHKDQYPEGTEFVYSNFTPRSNRLFAYKQEGDGYVVFYGLQGFIKEFLIDLWNDEFFKKPPEEAIEPFFRRCKNAGCEITIGHLYKLHALGYLPLHIKALPEGTLCPIKVPPFTIINTDKEFGWLPNMFETLISTEMWKVMTNSTIAYEYLKICKSYSDKTCTDDSHLPFQCHDFSMRGMSGVHDAGKSGSGHLLSFNGTDAVPAIDYMEQYYLADSDKELVGGSVPATEHSVMCMGEKATELQTFLRLINDTYPTGIVSIVSDTWDFWKVMTEYLPLLKNNIMKRDGKVVIRPDSGDPVDIICGVGSIHKPAETPETKGAVEVLWDIFGGTVNEKGYKVLDPHIGLIYGDSITLERSDEILKRLKAKGFASSNIVFGVGSYTYQYSTRDTFGFAMKATWGQVNGEGIEIFKDPATDSGTKKSAKGRLKVFECPITGQIKLEDQAAGFEERKGLLQTVFRDGEARNVQSFQVIRERLQATLGD